MVQAAREPQVKDQCYKQKRVKFVVLRDGSVRIILIKEGQNFDPIKARIKADK